MPVPSQERHRPVPRHMLQERPVMLSPVPLHCAHFPLECGSHSRQPPLSPRRSQEGISIYACSIQPETTVSTRLTRLPEKWISGQKTEPKRGKPGTAPRLEQNPKNLGNIKETSILGSTLLWDVRVH